MKHRAHRRPRDPRRLGRVRRAAAIVVCLGLFAAVCGGLAWVFVHAFGARLAPARAHHEARTGAGALLGDLGRFVVAALAGFGLIALGTPWVLRAGGYDRGAADDLAGPLLLGFTAMLVVVIVATAVGLSRT